MIASYVLRNAPPLAGPLTTLAAMGMTLAVSLGSTRLGRYSLQLVHRERERTIGVLQALQPQDEVTHPSLGLTESAVPVNESVIVRCTSLTCTPGKVPV